VCVCIYVCMYVFLFPSTRNIFKETHTHTHTHTYTRAHARITKILKEIRIPIRTVIPSFSLLVANFCYMLVLWNFFVNVRQSHFYYSGGSVLGAVNRSHRTHRSWFPCYACAIRGIVRRARGCIKAATCWATRILPIRFRRGYILLEDEKGSEHPIGD